LCLRKNSDMNLMRDLASSIGSCPCSCPKTKGPVGTVWETSLACFRQNNDPEHRGLVAQFNTPQRHRTLRFFFSPCRVHRPPLAD
jgi:hypothetical protein